MSKLIFKGDAFAALMKASGESGKPVKLVHDEGFYLCCFAVEGQKPLVAYAEGYAPTDPDYREKAREAVGGDDFAEDLHISREMKQALEAPGGELQVTVKPTSFSVTALVPNPPETTPATQPPAKKPRGAAQAASH